MKLSVAQRKIIFADKKKKREMAKMEFAQWRENHPGFTEDELAAAQKQILARHMK